MASPQVFTTEFLATILEKYFQKTFNISHLRVDNMTNSALNFCSQLKRITVTYCFENEEKSRVLSLVAKCFPENEFMAQYVTDMKMFDCEIETYRLVIPKLLDFDYREKVSPRVFYTCLEPKPMLIMEDLSFLSYKVLDKREGLDLEHCYLAVEKLAYYHAATMALHEQDSSLLTKFNYSPFRRRDRLHEIMSTSYDEVVKVCQNWPDLSEYVDKLRRAKDHILSKVYDLQNLQVNIRVLNRGDFWTTNILFNYAVDGTIADVAFVDVQHSTFTSPCFDLHFFLATSIKADIKIEKKSIIDHYFDTFVKKLKRLHLKTIPTRAMFDEDFCTMSYCGFAASIYGLQFMKSDRTDGDPEIFLADDSKGSYRYDCFNNEAYLKELFHYLPFYRSLGMLDVSL